MLSLYDRLRSQPKPAKRPSPAPTVQDCLIRESHFPLPAEYFHLSDGLLRMMQGDETLPSHCDRQHILFLDTETTGLSGGAGTVAFLVGVGYIDETGITVLQYLMRDYNEERYVLEHVRRHLESTQLLVTYNGKSFDMPLLASRFTMNRIRFDPLSVPHADLIHTARRVWKLRIGRCSLSHLEEVIFG